MATRRISSHLFYFTVDDEGILAECFAGLDTDTFAIAYKVEDTDTEDVFVMTSETRDALDRAEVPYSVLAEEDGSKLALYHSPLSREELSDFEEPLKALALAYRAIAMYCVGVNGESDLGFDLSGGMRDYTYFTAPAGHTFIWRLFSHRDDALNFVEKLTIGDRTALNWAESIPMESKAELESFH